MDNTGDEIYINTAAENEENFNFDDPAFHLEERDFPTLTIDFSTPIETLRAVVEKNKNNFTCFHINTGSVPKHYDELVRLVYETNVDALAVSEHFICEKTPKMLYEIPGYNFFHKDRINQSRGGSGIYVKDCFDCKEIKLCKEVTQPEICFVEVKLKNAKLALGCIYKSPLISYTQYSVLTEILSPIITRYEHHIITGDYNINYLTPDSSACKYFRDHVTEPFDLTQVITEPTRITDKTSTLIDLFLVSYPENVKSSGVIDIPAIADHCLIFASYALKKPKFKPKIIVKRKMQNFNIDNFKHDMAMAPWGSLSAFDYGDLDNRITVIENIYRDIMDKHCPKVEIRVTHPSSTSWRTEEIKQLQTDRDRYYSKFKKMKKNENVLKRNDTNFKAKLDITKNIYLYLRNKVTHSIRKSKIQMFDEKINKKLKQPREFHHALRTHDVVDSKSSTHKPVKIPPNVLNQTFLSNNNAHIDEQKLLSEETKINNKPRNNVNQFHFSETSGLEVKKIVKSIKTNACGVDDISAFFIKISIDYTADILADIINASFSNNFFPTRWKEAIVKPIPKNDNPVQASDYRPISLLPAFSKIAEKIAAKQMSTFLKEHKLLDKLQSAYKNAHSTTTALLTVSDDIFKAIDESEVTLLTLLDYSKAFDTANHRLILAKLKHFGFHEDALSWILSYLSDRKQKVRTDSDSDWEYISNGVPQGSILGPLLFTVLVSDVSDNITTGKYHTYADDLQLLLTFKAEDSIQAHETTNTLLNNIAEYSSNNFLKLNTDKTKYILIGSQGNLKKVSEHDLPPLKLNGDILEKKSSVKNLGVIFDENMSWTDHLNTSICKAYGRLKQAYKFRKFLSLESRFTLIETYILSLFNYGDPLFLNISAKLSNKIQRVQNSCMRFVFGLRKYDHISPAFGKNKTLNMENRRKMHALILMHKITIGEAPEYLSEKIVRHADLHDYNTRGRENIAVQRVNTSLRSNTFFISISKLYNQIMPLINENNPERISVGMFKTKCKKYITNQQFPQAAI